MMNDLTNKTAFITGGSKGIGYGIAEVLLRAGMHVAITSRSQQAADEAVARLSQAGAGKALGLAADVRSYEAQQQAIDAARQAFGSIDAVIANAGLGHFGSIEELSPQQWQETIDTNLTGVFYTAKAAIAALKASQGYLITIASLAGTNFFAGGSAYNASKFGLVGFTQAVMLDLRHFGVRVTTIMPGSVATYFNNHTPNPADEWKIQPEDIGQLVWDVLKIPGRTLPSKIEVRPAQPPQKK